MRKYKISKFSVPVFFVGIILSFIFELILKPSYMVLTFIPGIIGLCIVIFTIKKQNE